MKNFLVILALSFSAQIAFSKTILLTPASSTIVEHEDVTVACEGEGQDATYCRGDFSGAALYKDEKDVTGSPVERLVNQFDSIIACLNTISQKTSTSVAVTLTPKSSAAIKDALISVSCPDDQKAKFSCKDKFGRALLFKITTAEDGTRLLEFVKGYGSLDECLAFVKSGGSEATERAALKN